MASYSWMSPPSRSRRRIAARLRDDPVADSLVDRPADRRAEEGPRVSGAQTVDHQLGQDVELRAAVAHGEHQGNGLRREAARDEREHLTRRPVEPLRIVDEAHERALLGGGGQQVQRRESHQEPIECGGATHPECRS
jgi:hypothetical protein